MKVNWTLGVLLLVVLLAGLYVGHSCGKPPSEFEVALDSLEVRLEQAVKDSARWSAVVDSVAGVADRSAQDAEAARNEARAKMLQALRLRASARLWDSLQATGNRDTAPYESQAPSSHTSLVQAFDSLAQAYVLMVRVDSLNQVTIGALTRRIESDSQYIASLERLREAARVVLETKPGRKLFGCRVGPSALIGLDGRVSAGAGVTCGI